MARKITASLICIIIVFIIFAILRFREPGRNEAIESFRKNTDVFLNIQSYAQTTEGILNVNKKMFYVKIRNDYDNAVEENKIKANILYLINSLHFKVVYENKDSTIFFTKLGASKHGIIYLKNDEKLPAYMAYIEKLMEHWYYFETYYA